ncbi:MAG: RNA-directed DNA polymerase, partial [Proteobacteria bacterium]|nr:RNA-directed DNA polymerase [Pseudomonadota bacterium]
NVREDLKPIIQKEMDRLERLGIIKKGLTGYSSPVLLVKRKQQNLYRVVTDFRILNERLVRVNHAFPIVKDCLEAIGASKCEVMSVLDLRDAYHTLPLAEESQKYCGITPYYGCSTYVYLRMGMGMSCSPALWQQFIHIIWEELPNKERYKIIMDDILIFSTKEQHWEDLQNLFAVLIKYGLKISPHKCQLFRSELVYMGLQFLVKDGVAHYTAMKEKCDAVRNMQTPKSVKECRTFCGMVNFLSTFCKNLRELLIPIYDLTKKRARFNWTDKHQKAFEEIKKLLVKPPVLRMVSGDGIFRLESDTSRTAVGGTLYQWQDNQWVLVGYHSKKLPEPVRNYGVTELELTGLIANIHGFEQKLRNNYFEIIVDHKAIDYLTKSRHQPTTTRLSLLLQKLADYTFDLKYLEGNKLKVSDALSRLYIEEKHKINDVIPLNFLLHCSDHQLLLNYIKARNSHYTHQKNQSADNA